MAARVRLRIDHAKLSAVVGGASKKAVDRAASKTVNRVRANIITNDLVNSGRLLGSFQTVNATRDPLYPRVAIGSPLPYVKYPEFGTRAHGPVRAKALRFSPKGSQGVVFAKWVRGVRPYAFMKTSLDQLRPADFE